MDVKGYFEGFLERDWQHDTETDQMRIAIAGFDWFAVEQALIDRTDNCLTSVVVSGSREKVGRIGRKFGTDRELSYYEFHGGVARDA